MISTSSTPINKIRNSTSPVDIKCVSPQTPSEFVLVKDVNNLNNSNSNNNKIDNNSNNNSNINLNFNKDVNTDENINFSTLLLIISTLLFIFFNMITNVNISNHSIDEMVKFNFIQKIKDRQLNQAIRYQALSNTEITFNEIGFGIDIINAKLVNLTENMASTFKTF